MTTLMYTLLIASLVAIAAYALFTCCAVFTRLAGRGYPESETTVSPPVDQANRNEDSKNPTA